MNVKTLKITYYGSSTNHNNLVNRSASEKPFFFSAFILFCLPVLCLLVLIYKYVSMKKSKRKWTSKHFQYSWTTQIKLHNTYIACAIHVVLNLEINCILSVNLTYFSKNNERNVWKVKIFPQYLNCSHFS